MADQTQTIEEIKKQVAVWLEQHWDADRPLKQWREILVDGGWAVPDWPEAYFGRGFDETQSAAVESVFQEFGAVGIAQGGPGRLAAQTLLVHGSDAQKDEFLRPILTGEHAWCQLFSEPGSGSDLAGLTTKAEKIGDRWVVNGQKVWNTSAHHADYGILLARTNWDVPKHQGISYFIINMRQPGVEVRPLKQMNGHASFNEVFMADAEVLPGHLVGAEGDGWQIANTTLSIERQGFGNDRSGGCARHLEGRP